MQELYSYSLRSRGELLGCLIALENAKRERNIGSLTIMIGRALESSALSPIVIFNNPEDVLPYEYTDKKIEGKVDHKYIPPEYPNLVLYYRPSFF